MGMISLSVTITSLALTYFRYSNGVRRLPFLFRCFDVMSQIVTIFIVVRSRERIRKLLQDLLEPLCQQQLSSLRQFSMTYILLMIISSCIHLLLVINHLIVVKANMYHIVLDAFLFYNRMTDWFMSSIFTYVFVVKLIQITEDNYFTQVGEQVCTTPSKMIAIHRRAMVCLREELLSSFSLIPCLWFANVFIHAAASIVTFFELDHLHKLNSIIVRVSGLFYLIFACESCASHTEAKTEELITRMLVNDTMDSQASFVAELRHKPGVTFNVWSLFKIRSNLILSFVSALITFTVLFVQLAHQVP